MVLIQVGAECRRGAAPARGGTPGRSWQLGKRKLCGRLHTLRRLCAQVDVVIACEVRENEVRMEREMELIQRDCAVHRVVAGGMSVVWRREALQGAEVAVSHVAQP